MAHMPIRVLCLNPFVYQRVLLLIYCLFFIGCSSYLKSSSPVLVEVNGSSLTLDDFREQLKEFHYKQLKNSQEKAHDLDLDKFIDRMIDQELIVQEARRSALDQQTDFFKAMAKEKERICLTLFRNEHILKELGSLTQEDVDLYSHEKGLGEKNLSEITAAEKAGVLSAKEKRLYRRFLDQLKAKAQLERKEPYPTDYPSLLKMNGPLVVVNGEAISGPELAGEIQIEIEHLKEASQEALLIKDGLEQMIEQKLLVQEAKKADYDKNLKVLEYLKRQERAFLYRAFCDRLFQTKVRVSEQEIEQYYHDQAEMFQTAPLVFIERLEVENLSQAEGIYQELISGADFTFLGKNGAVNQAVRYEKEWVTILQFKPQVRAQIEALSEGEFSQPIAFDQGYWLVKKKKVKPGVTRSFAQVRKEIKRHLNTQHFQLALTDCLKQLRAQSDLVIYQENKEKLKSTYRPKEEKPEVREKVWDN